MNRVLHWNGEEQREGRGKREASGKKGRKHEEKERRTREAVKAKRDFYSSDEWRSVRYNALKAAHGKCALCGNSRKEGQSLEVDHIRPRSRYPELALDSGNLQVLCRDCNIGKGAHDTTDWR